MMPLSRCGAKARVARKVMTEMAPSYFATFHECRKPAGWMSPMTAIMITAANVHCGRWWSSGVKKSSAASTNALVNTLENPVRAPACRLTAEREKDPETG